MNPELISRITCPHCGCEREERMPVDACQWYYQCTGCGKLLRPKPGDCCVFCSFGSLPCPPKQLDTENDCCGNQSLNR